MRKIIVLIMLLIAFAVPASAKEGFYFGVNVLFHEFTGDVDNLDAGNGLGLRGGFGLNKYLSFEAAIFKTKHDLKSGGSSVDFKGGTIDAKLNFPLTGSNIEPYIFGGVGTYKLDYQSSTLDGTGGQIGIGMDIYLFPELNFNVGIARRNITFDDNGTDKKAKVNALDFGFTYHFI